MGGSSFSAVLSEARSLVTRLYDRDRLSDGLLNASQSMQEKINCMREYQEDLHELHDLVHHKPRTALVHSLQQENRQIRLLQEENRALRTTLSEYEAGLELIMGRHRAQMGQLRRLAALQVCSVCTSFAPFLPLPAGTRSRRRWRRRTGAWSRARSPWRRPPRVASSPPSSRTASAAARTPPSPTPRSSPASGQRITHSGLACLPSLPPPR